MSRAAGPSMQMKRYQSIFGTLWLTGLISLQGIPETGIYRSLFLLLGLLHLVFIIKSSTSKQIRPKPSIEGWLLITLTLWLIAQSATLSLAPTEALINLSEHWGKILLVIWMAIALVAYSNDNEDKRSWLIHGAFFGYFIHVISTLAFQAWALTTTGHLAPGNSFLNNYGYVSPYVTGSLAFLFADLASRYAHGVRLLKTNTYVVLIAILATFAAQWVLDAKASHVMATALILITSGALIATHNKYRLRVFIMASLALLTLFFATTQLSNRWNNSASSIEYAIHNTTDIRATFVGSTDPNHPVNKSDGSFFLRYAWGKTGVDAIIDRPLGTGYGSEGFGRFVHDTYGPKGIVSSHSGWIDFTIDNGIPGLLLLLLLSGALIYRGWKEFLLNGNPIGLAMSLTVINYIGRCAIDGHLVGSRLSGFFFVVALLWALNATPNNTHNAPSKNTK
jgi:O-antigen ligase